MTIETATPEASDADIESRLQLALFGDDEPDDDKKQPAPEGNEYGDADDAEKVNPDEVENDDAQPDTLAAYLGLAEEQVFEAEDGKVYINAKVDGEITQVPMDEVVKSYQLLKHVNNKSMMVSEQQKMVAQEYQTVRTEAANRFQVLDKMSEALEQQFMSQYQNVDWQRLRVENPAEYVAAQQDFQQMMASLQQAKQVTIQQRAQLEAIQAEREEREYAQVLAQQAQLVLQNIPAWKNPGTRVAESNAIRAFLSESYGYSDQELNGVTDFRQIQVIRDAMAYRKGKQVAEQKIQKPVPKFQKPGAVRGNDMSKAREAKAKIGNLKRSGSVDDAAAALLSRM